MSPDLPADMVEAAARALAQIMGSEGYLFAGRHPHREQDREDYRFNAREILAAALATGEVREERGQLAPPGTRDVVRLVRRTVHSLPSGHVLTSPWEEVSD